MRFVETISTPLLAQHGFRKRAGAVFTIPIAEGVLGWLGLNSATKYESAGHVEVNPVVRVRHQQVEALVARLTGERPDSYLPPTASIPIGYLHPENAFRSWILHDEATDVADEMVAAIAEYGLPFMRRHAALPALQELLAGGHAGPNHMVAFRLPVVWLLRGDAPRAIAAADEMLAEQEGRTDLWTRQYQAFVAGLHAIAEGL